MKFQKIIPADRPVTSGSSDSNDIHKFRRYLPQVLACLAKNLLLFQMGFTLAFPTILITALTGLSPDQNPNESLHLMPSETTWIASISFICQPIGSIFSGFITEPIGRKWAMIMVNVPVGAAWLLMYYAQEFNVILIAFGLLGISVGLMEASIMTYIGEISEPSIRGVLSALAGIAYTFGVMFVFVLGTFMSWRHAALVCFCAPWIAAFAIYFVPETPIWLLFKNRSDDAIRALQWLRGWVPAAAVMDEFIALQKYKVRVQSCACEEQKKSCTHGDSNFSERVKDFFRRPTLLPFILLTFMFFIAQFCGIFAMRPYIVRILFAYRSPVEPQVVTVWLGVLGILANVVMVAIIRVYGKRSITLISMAVTFISCFVLGLYGFICLPSETTSFHSLAKEVVTSEESANAIAYIPLISLCVMQFATSLATSTPNLLLCELFPFKSRAFATGIAASTNYIWAFAGTKLYYNFEMSMSLPGTVLLFGFIGLLGFIGIYLFLPETEGRSLEDIETYYADNRRKLTDKNIAINSARSQMNSVLDLDHTLRPWPCRLKVIFCRLD